MSHRKYECPRHGSLAFLPRKRTRKHRGHLRAFQQDDPASEVHLTAFIGFKAGMTHVLRDVDRPGSKIHKKEAVEAVTIIECPPVTVVGVVGYQQTITGLHARKTVFAAHLSDQFKRRLYKNWYKSQHKAFSQYHKAFEGKGASKAFEDGLEDIAKNCQVSGTRGQLHSTRRSPSLSLSARARRPCRASPASASYRVKKLDAACPLTPARLFDRSRALALSPLPPLACRSCASSCTRT